MGNIKFTDGLRIHWYELRLNPIFTFGGPDANPMEIE